MRTFIKYGSDAQRLEWSQKSKEDCKSFELRTTVANEMIQSPFVIDKYNGHASYATHHLTDLVSEVMQWSNDVISKSNLKRRWKPNKPFIKLDFVNPSKLTWDSPFIKLATHKDIISAVSKYMGHVPILYNCGLWYSKNVPKNLASSQLFHCDWEDINNIKLFVHISNITSEDGPLIIIPANKSKQVRLATNYTFGPTRYYLQDKEVEQHCSKDNFIELSGQPGTLSFLDTCSCFHYGSRVKESKNRIVAVFQYLSPAAVNLMPKYRNVAPFKHLMNDELDQVNKLLVGI